MTRMTSSYRFKSLTRVSAASTIWNAAGYVGHPHGTDKYVTGPVGDLQPPEAIAGRQEGIFQGISEGNSIGPWVSPVTATLSIFLACRQQMLGVLIWSWTPSCVTVSLLYFLQTASLTGESHRELKKVRKVIQVFSCLLTMVPCRSMTLLWYTKEKLSRAGPWKFGLKQLKQLPVQTWGQTERQRQELRWVHVTVQCIA